MEQLLHYAIKNDVSDIHITERKICKVRINGDMEDAAGMRLDLTQITEFISGNVPKVLEKLQALCSGENKTPVDGAFAFGGRRFRLNAYRSMNGICLAIRLLSDKIDTLDHLDLPSGVERFTQLESGLILIVGTTGSGKSTTLASIIDSINHSRRENILTIEQPIEYVYQPDLCRIEQTEVGVHVESFSAATVAAMRQDPNIILIGEMRDLNTIQNAVTLAETGHLVFGTLHAKSVPDTVDRMIDVFPAAQQEQMRLQVSAVLKGILHQQLVKSQKGGRTPLVELLHFDDVAASMVRGHQKSNALRDHLRGKSAKGNVHIADNAAWHAKCGRINLEDIKNMLSPDDYSMAKSIAASGTVGGGF